jgi:hypothetical protein
VLADPRVSFVHKEWLKDQRPVGWAKFGLELADTALDAIGSQPEVLGIGQKAAGILRALTPSLNSIVDRIKLDGGGDIGFGERLVNTFVRSAIDSVAANPSLVTSEERWKPIIQGVITPLKQEVEKNEGLEFLAHERISHLLNGPMAHGVLTAINGNTSAFLKGDAKSEKLLGEITRTFLGNVASINPENFQITRAFSETGMLKIYESALGTVARRPDLVVRGSSMETQAIRQFVQNMGHVFEQAPPPFDNDPSLASSITGAAFEILGEYGTNRIQGNAGNADWDSAWADVYSHLYNDLLQGMKLGLEKKGNPTALARVFSKDQALDIMKIMSAHIAASPHMLTGRGANSEVSNLARISAEAIASDDYNLLGSDDWKKIIGVMFESAAQNPGVLFNLTSDGDASKDIALDLISIVLKSAGQQFEAGNNEGQVLFGDTLREVLVATLQAANRNLSDKLKTQTDEEWHTHIDSLGDYITRINAHSWSDNPLTTMNANEWVHVFKFYIAHILEQGPDAIQNIDAEAILLALRSDGAPSTH